MFKQLIEKIFSTFDYNDELVKNAIDFMFNGENVF